MDSKSLVLFDLDGTLLNTIDDLGASANYALAQMGMPTHHISSYPHFVGNGIAKLIERVVPAECRKPEILRALGKVFVEYYDQHLTDKTEPYPGIVDMLDELNARGIAMAVASNKYQRAAEKIIHHFFPQIPWVAVMGQQTGVPVKPDPSIVFAVLSEHPTPKAKVLYVGDSNVDMETASRAGVESVGVTWGFGTEAQLRSAYADHIVTAPHQIIDLV